MIRIELDEAALGATRIAIGPLCETSCRLHLARAHGLPSWPYEAWAVRAGP
ncbi:hypothetical protein [Streptomyces sp. NPDC060035]|uniref:hypothetical protein n=1 Tax=Streptomyces sp. NPDC060035 TaxID=3347044 RepID=UPI00369B3CC7